MKLGLHTPGDGVLKGIFKFPSGHFNSITDDKSLPTDLADLKNRYTVILSRANHGLFLN